MKPYFPLRVCFLPVVTSSLQVSGGPVMPASWNIRLFQNSATLFVYHGTAYCAPWYVAASTGPGKNSLFTEANSPEMSFRTFAAASSAIQALSTEATSGPWPARTAAMILSSMLSADTELRTIFMWRFSCWYWLIAFSSGGCLIVVNGLITQKLSVVDPEEGVLEQLAVTRPLAMAAPVIAVCLRKFRRDMGANTRGDDSASESRQYPVVFSVISLLHQAPPKIVITGFAAVLAADPHRCRAGRHPRSAAHRARLADPGSQQHRLPAARRRGHHGHPAKVPSRPTSRGRER